MTAGANYGLRDGYLGVATRSRAYRVLTCGPFRDSNPPIAAFVENHRPLQKATHDKLLRYALSVILVCTRTQGHCDDATGVILTVLTIVACLGCQAATEPAAERTAATSSAGPSPQLRRVRLHYRFHVKDLPANVAGHDADKNLVRIWLPCAVS